MGRPLITHYLGPHCWPALRQPASGRGGWGGPACCPAQAPSCPGSPFCVDSLALCPLDHAQEERAEGEHRGVPLKGPASAGLTGGDSDMHSGKMR